MHRYDATPAGQGDTKSTQLRNSVSSTLLGECRAAFEHDAATFTVSGRLAR
jgi:hypothetical protein